MAEFIPPDETNKRNSTFLGEVNQGDFNFRGRSRGPFASLGQGVDQVVDLVGADQHLLVGLVVRRLVQDEPTAKMRPRVDELEEGAGS